MLKESREIIDRLASPKERAELGTQRLDNQRTFNALKTVVQRLQVHQAKSERTTTVIDVLSKASHKDVSATRLKDSTSPLLVLEAAKRLYGLDLAEYSVGVGRDGSPRIFHDQKQYNLGDFFTKHLGKSWTEAKPVLTDCYYATLSDALPPPNKALWSSFNAWRSQAYEQRKTSRETSRSDLRAETLRSRATYKAQKEQGSKLKGRARQTFMAKTRAEHVLTLQQIKEKRDASRQKNKTPNRNAEYRTYLTELAGKGDLTALGELRRLSTLQAQDQSFITGDQSRNVLPLPQYRIDPQGTVTYWFKEQTWEALVKDSTKGVAVVKDSAAAYDTALQIAVARYGRTLTLKGDDVFMKKMVEAAKRSGMELSIRNGNDRNKPITKISPEKTR